VLAGNCNSALGTTAGLARDNLAHAVSAEQTASTSHQRQAHS